MNKYSFIYKIINPNGKVYIGQTTRPIKERMEEYGLLGQIKNQKLICRSVEKYGWSAHKWEVIYRFSNPKVNINDAENLFIDFYCSYYEEHPERGLNLSKFANTPMRGRKHSPESIAKMKVAQLGYKRNPESIQKMLRTKAEKGFRTTKGQKRSPESIKKAAEALRGHITTDETKKKISEGIKNFYIQNPDRIRRGFRMSEENKRKLIEKNTGNKYWLGKPAPGRKPVISYNEDGSEYIKFPCLKEALLHFGKKPNSTSNLTRSLISGKLCYGKFWKYENTNQEVTSI